MNVRVRNERRAAPERSSAAVHVELVGRILDSSAKGHRGLAAGGPVSRKTMASRGTIRKSGEAATLWLRCGYRALLLYEDEIRSVEGPYAG